MLLQQNKKFYESLKGFKSNKKLSYNFIFMLPLES